MTSPVLNEQRHSFGFLVSEAAGRRSREQVTIKNQGGTALLAAGTVLGLIAAGSATSAAQTVPGANTGNGTMSAVTVSAGAVPGAYEVQYVSATEFNVFDPTGKLVGEGRNGVAFAAGGLGFTMTAGGTAFVAGDGFVITVAQSADAGKYAPVNLSGVDGSQNAAAILGNVTDATQGDVKAAIAARECEVNGSELIYPAGASAQQIAALNAQLKALQIIIR